MRGFHPGVIFIDMPDGVFLEERHELGTAQQFSDAFTKQSEVVGRHEKASLSMQDGRLDSSHVRTNNRRAASHGFKRGNSKRLVPRRRDEYIRGAIVVVEH